MTPDSQERTVGLVSPDPQAPKETPASQESQEDPEVPELKEPWGRWASQAQRDRREPQVCLVGLEVLEDPELLVFLDPKVNPDQQESDLQEFKDQRENQGSQVSQGHQD